MDRGSEALFTGLALILCGPLILALIGLQIIWRLFEVIGEALWG